MKLTFYGAAQTTTGSMHLIEVNGKRILLDCGLYQGHRKEAFEKNRNLPIKASSIDYVILSHAHIDHSGNLPQLVKQGFRGRVFARASTVELCDILLRDSCFLQKRDLEYVNKKRKRDGKNLFEPLYDESDVVALMQLFVPVHMHQPREICKGVTLEFFNAGHILGSALVQLDVKDDTGSSHRLLFSGDLGQPNQPILRHFEYPSGADILLIESTYADRFHPTADDVELRLEKYLKHIDRYNSKLIIPAFSVGRTQQIIWYLNRLRLKGKVPREVKLYVDSPLSRKATLIYSRHPEVYNAEARQMLSQGVNPLEYPGMTFIGSPEESMALNETPGPMIIIAASGMCEGGRVLHHLKHAVQDANNIVLICGYQAENTLGRRIVEKRNPIRILGEEVQMNAKVEVINALSAHADRAGLIDWISEIKDNVRYAFAVHGDIEKVTAMTELLKEQGVPKVAAPAPGETFEF
ncbi:MAG: MBL fold metallo-hydrolase [Kiritimatiellae bacterium]|nr:MBL fold metallo-hydrolase [Kiritimatiellia bacterium]